MRKPVGTALLWILAGASVVLLVYELATLIGSVLRPLIANPLALQTDFHYYYDAAVRFSQEPSRLYLRSDDVIAGFAYPPPAILPFMWLSGWPLGTALLAFTIASYLVLLIALQQWTKGLKRHGFSIDRRTAIAGMLIAFALGPTYMNAIFGQVNAFVLACAVAFVSLSPATTLEAALVLAIGTWLKVYPIMLAAIGLWDRRTWRALGWSIVAAIAIAVLVMTIVPAAAFHSFFFDVLPSRIDKTAIHISNQSLVAFLERFRYPSHQFLNWTGEQAVTVTAAVRIVNVIAVAVAIAGLWLRTRNGTHLLSNAAILMALIAVAAPLGWGHTYVMVLPLVMLQVIAMRDARPIVAIVIFCCVAALMVPAGRRFAFVEGSPDWMLNLIYSRYLLATVVLAGVASTVIETPEATAARASRLVSK
ncbi:MAG TPA: glycosyltransferase family 87 protein [Vicinamibacterales bacterium]|nr:glycosyltransferase family 87 protein [Vicinamibacterales bacterium]